MTDRVATYNHIFGLKAAGVVIEFTPEQIEEYVKCAQDVNYFAVHYCKIITLDEGETAFNPYEYQTKLLTTIHENRKVVMMQPRQTGKTTTAAIYMLWYTLFQDNKKVAICANKAKTAMGILARYQSMYKALPVWMQQGVITWNKGDIELENGSIVFTTATTADGLRSESCNLVFIDECAFIPNNVSADFFSSIYPTISSGSTTKVVVCSTPKGYNYFWHLWTDAVEGRNGFLPVRIHYSDVRGRDEAWAAEQRRILGDVKFNQEVLCQFLGSSLTLLSADAIAAMKFKKPISSRLGVDIFVDPIPLHNYICVADTASGVGGDYSTFSIFDITELPYVQVARYRSNRISPLLYPNIICSAAQMYNEAFVLIETNANEQVPYIIQSEIGYENLLCVTRKKNRQILSGGYGTCVPGVKTDKQVKRVGCQNLKHLIEDNKLLINDADTISEFSTFIEKSGSYAADTTYHDDMVMTCVLFAWAATDSMFKDLNDVDLRKEMYEQRIQEMEQTLTPFGFFSNGLEEDMQAISDLLR